MANIYISKGETKILSNREDVLTARSLGTSIALVMMDTSSKVIGVTCVVLPSSSIDSSNSVINETHTEEYRGKYADTAIQYLIEKMTKAGANKRNLIAYMAGGAQLLTFEKGSNIFNIGARNNVAIRTQLEKHSVKLAAADVGGNKGRSLKIDVSSGLIYTQTIGEQEIVLGGIKTNV